jgi:hypothetical protein
MEVYLRIYLLLFIIKLSVLYSNIFLPDESKSFRVVQKMHILFCLYLFLKFKRLNEIVVINGLQVILISKIIDRLFCCIKNFGKFARTCQICILTRGQVL